MIADPYTAWGVEHEHVRPAVANLSLAFASAALIFILIAAGLAFLWDTKRFDWKRLGLAGLLFFFGGTAFARIIWVQFFVLA